MVADDDRDRLSKYLLRDGDIVFSRVGSIGRFGLVTDAEEGWLFSGRLLRVRLKRDYAPFVYHQMCTTSFIRQIESVAVGQTMPSLNTVIVNDLLVALPSPREQRAIAAALSDADALVESLDALIAKKRDMKQAAMQQLLTGRTRLRGESTEWAVVKVGEFARTLKGRGLSRDVVLEAGTNPCLLYGELFTTYRRVAREVGARTNSLDGELSVCGDVLMPGSTTTSGEDLATATALLVDGVRLGGDVNIIRPDLQRIDPRWLAYVITHCHRQDVALRAQGVTIHHLYGRDIASIEMRLPDRDEQTRLADVLEAMDAEIDALVAQREKAELVKQGMMQELLSGRVRLA
jgi:type I restriction enzyme S subunit